MGFDLASATDMHSDLTAVNTTSFDINSAKEEPQLQEATSSIQKNPLSPISGFVRGLMNFMGGSVLDKFSEASYAAEKSDEFPSPAKGESMASYSNRVASFYQPRENKIISEGAMKQFDNPMQLAITLAAPQMSAVQFTQLGSFMALDKVRNTVQNIVLPDASPILKDILDLGSFVGEAKLVGGASDALGDFLHNSLLSKGKSPTIDLYPDVLKNINNLDVNGIGKLFAEPLTTERPSPFVKSSQEGWPAPDVETPTGVMSGEVLEKLGINQKHMDASQASGLPVRVPISKFIDLAQDPKWDEYKQIMSFDVKGWDGENNVSQGTEGSQAGETQISNDNGNDGETKEVGGEEVATRTPDHRESDNSEPPVHGEGDISQKTNTTSSTKTDNQEEAPASLPVETSLRESIPPEGEKGNKTSGLAKSVEEDAIHKGLIEELGDLPSYKTRDMDEIAKKVSDFINKDPELAKKIALGEAPEQDGLRSQELFTGLKSKAFKEGDISLIHELGTSEKASAMATELGQRVKALDSKDQENPINILKDIQKAKEKPTKEMVNDKGKTAKIVKREFEKAKPKIDEWKSFIDQIRC